MSYPTGRPRRHISWALVGLTLLLMVGLLGLRYGDSLAAGQIDGDDQPKLTPQMEAFLADQLPPQELPAMGATPCVGGTAGGYPCNNIDLLAFMPLADFSAGSGNDSWGWNDPLNGKEYAIMGLNNGTAFVDISDPINPIYLGKLPTHTSSSSWRDIKVYADHAFIVSEAGGHGLQVFDLTELRTVTTPPVTFSNTAHFSGFGSAHNIVINEDSGFAFAVGAGTCSGGLHMVNIQNPTSPTDAGCFSSDGYTHDAQCVNYNGPDVTHQGKEICFNANEDTLTIVDVTNKAAPIQLSRTGYPGSAYTHQNWITDDHVYVLLDDELDEQSSGHNTRTRVFDVSDLDAPVLVGFHDGATPAIDHNMYVHDGYVYQANYRSGLRVLDISDVANANLSETAFFDIYPANDNPSFNGAWSTYPYYQSGVVIISGIEQGLFIVQPALAPDFRVTSTDTSLAVCGNGIDSTILDIMPRNGYVGSVSLSADGLPAGASPSFSDNPVAPPASSTFTVTVSGTTAGTYPFSIVATDASLTHTLPMQLDVSASAPNAPALVSPANGASNVSATPTYNWNASAGSTSYFIEIATDAGFTNVVDSATVAGTSYVGGLLATNSLHYWRVTADNPCGDATSAVWSFTTQPAPGDCSVGSSPNVVFQEDFEAGTGGWTSSGLGNTWALSSANPNSGTSHFHANDVSSVSDQYLILPPVALPAGQAPLTFQFWNYQAMEDGGAGCYDGGVLEVSVDGGTTWIRLESELLTDPYDGLVDSGFGNPIAGTNAWCGDPQPYLNSIVDIDAWAGQTAQFRMRLATDNSVSHPGWDVDDVKIQSCIPAGGNTPPTITAANITSPIDENDTATLSGSFTDPDATDTFTMTVDWGDSSTPEVFNYPAGSTTFTETHQYLDDDPTTGTPSDILDVNLTLEDSAGGADNELVQIQVDNVDPVANAGPDATVPVSATISFSGSASDVGSLDTHTFEWDFGDGGTASGTLTPTHVYTATGTYTVTLTVTDDDTGVGIDEKVVTVVDEVRVYLPMILNTNPPPPAAPSPVSGLPTGAPLLIGGLVIGLAWRRRS